MILSAGFGTRLKPITDMIPKALVVHKSKPLIYHQIERLKKAGVDEVVINLHHMSEKIIGYLQSREFGIKINIIVEENILGTGGGIINAKEYLENEKFFPVINVDVDTDFELKKIIDFHSVHSSIATIAVQKRKASRYLDFSAQMLLVGRANENSLYENQFAFNGIHIISGEFFNEFYEKRYNDIIDLYLQLILRGKSISGFDTGDSYFKDLGRRENLV